MLVFPARGAGGYAFLSEWNQYSLSLYNSSHAFLRIRQKGPHPPGCLPCSATRTVPHMALFHHGDGYCEWRCVFVSRGAS